MTINFLRLLVQRRRIGLLPEIARGFLDLLDRRSGLATAQVTSAAALTPEQEERLRERLAAYTGLQIRLDTNVDPGLGGGLVARVDDLVFDGSVGTQLERLRARLMEGVREGQWQQHIDFDTRAQEDVDDARRGNGST